MMDFDQILETWRAQNTAPPYDVNHDVLRQALRTEEARVRRGQRIRRREGWFLWILGTGMAVWAGFWIAITITNSWPAIYAITAGVSLGMFAFGAVGTVWVSRGRHAEPQPGFASTLREEVRRNLELIDDQLSFTRQWIVHILSAASIVFGALLFSWTVTRSQNIPTSSGIRFFGVLLTVWIAHFFYKAAKGMRKAKPRLESRQRHLRELLAALDARE